MDLIQDMVNRLNKKHDYNDLTTCDGITQSCAALIDSMRARGMTLDDIADEVGLSPSTVWRLTRLDVTRSVIGSAYDPKGRTLAKLMAYDMAQKNKVTKLKSKNATPKKKTPTKKRRAA